MPELAALVDNRLSSMQGVCERSMFPVRVMEVPHTNVVAAAADLLNELKNLQRAYVNLMETGRDRILQHGGTCDPVDVMEAADPFLRASKAVIAKAEGGAA